MEKQQNSSRCRACTRIHLQRSPTSSAENLIAQASGKFGRAVAAAAVDHDHLVAARAQRRERLERSADRAGFVQDWHDNRQRQPRIQAWSRSSFLSTPSGACAFFQTPAAYLLASANVG